MIVALFTSVLVLWTAASPAESSSPALMSELTGLHDQWFAAFDKGDGATMDKLESDNLILVFPDGMIWKKSGSRVGEVKPLDVSSRKLTDVDVRQFGEAAVLTGKMTTIAKSQSDVAATTVVFVRQGGGWRIASAHWSPVAAKK
jgi:hypothetical protein